MRNVFLTCLLALFVLNLVLGQSNENHSYNLLPWPKEIQSGNSRFIIKEDFRISLSENTTQRLYGATKRFIRRLSDRTGVFLEHGFPKIADEQANFKIEFKRNGKLELREDESYSLEIKEASVVLKAETDIGALRGLETILQLIQSEHDYFYFPEINIQDEPRFPWRGLMIDVARHYQPVHVLKRNLDAMAAVKLNVFHWHLTDDQGFRVESKMHPKLHQLGSDGQYYSQDEIKDIVAYASDRGIRVVPEFDVPGHATAILCAYPELGSKDTVYTIQRYAGIFDATLDPTKELTYLILQDLFEEMSSLFPDVYFHIGGDENEGKHWNENQEIVNFKLQHGFNTNHDLQTYFNVRIQKILKELGKKIVGWEEIMTPAMPKTAIIHSWKGVNEGQKPGHSLVRAVKNGYQTILSNGYYLDLMHDLNDHYEVDPVPKNSNLSKEERQKILGGEATMWGELVTPLTIDSRIWPRTAAIAERFWSPKHVNDLKDLKRRLAVINFRLEELGISHIRNRDVILRNIVNGYDIDPLIILSEVCQPLKVYARNKGGIEYKSYSPFTLFADACTTDAKAALKFADIVNRYKENPLKEKSNLVDLLDQWIDNDPHFLRLRIKNPLIKEIAELSSNLKNLSAFIKKMIDKEQITKLDQEEFNRLLKLAKQPKADVELVTNTTFLKLFNYLKSNDL